MKEKTKVQQTYEWIEDKIKQGIYLPRHKIPSIRYLSNKLSVSTFTVSSAYDQLVSTGLIRSVAGAGYFVCEPTTKTEAFDVSSALINDVLDTGWLMTHLFGELPINKASGSGLLPNEWLLDSEVIANAVRKVTKEDMSFIYSYGHIQGYYPLREMFAKQLDQLGVSINPSLVITMPGVSSAIQTIIKTVTNAGDYVVVDDPSWFWLLGCLHQLDIKILTVKRNSDGPDINQLEHIFSEYKPKLYITNSILNNPTSYNISSSIMYKVLNLLNKHNVYLLEDDVYSHLDNRSLRYATLDQFEKVFYVTGVSKVLGANWRVGFLCTPKHFLEPILRQKMLSNMSSTELTERTVYKIWIDSHYKKHIESMKIKLARKHTQLKLALNKIGIEYPEQSNMGIFIWINTELDTTKMAIEASKDNWVLAPGYLFSPNNTYSTYLRLNVTRTTDEFIQWLYQYRLDNMKG